LNENHKKEDAMAQEVSITFANPGDDMGKKMGEIDWNKLSRRWFLDSGGTPRCSISAPRRLAQEKKRQMKQWCIISILSLSHQYEKKEKSVENRERKIAI
jgi:hypothetical protein